METTISVNTIEAFIYSTEFIVVLGCGILCICCAVVGCFTVLRQRALLGDVIAHAALPGVTLAFILEGTRSLPLLSLGAIATGWLSTFSVDLLSRRLRLSTDAAISLTLSVFYGAGIMLLTSIQKKGIASQAGLDTILFGKAAAMTPDDVLWIASVTIICLAVITLFFKELALISFDKEYASCTGFSLSLFEFILASLTVMAVVIGIQAVGVVLTSAMLITPPVASRYWTNNIQKMLWISAFIGFMSGICGTIISAVLPSMPTGPWIVVMATIAFIVSAVIAPQRGVLAKLYRRIEHKRSIERDNTLKAIFQWHEKQAEDTLAFAPADIISQDTPRLTYSLNKLVKEGYLLKNAAQYLLTDEGLRHGERIARRHRLWELYMTRIIGVSPENVHPEAESIEHILTPAMEAELERVLGYPQLDPHNSPIPRLYSGGRK